MAKFRFGAQVTVSAYTEVEATTPEEAMQIAAKRDVQIGGLMSGASESESWIIDDADGAPNNIEIEKD